jgi:hypothetical protein
VTPENIKIKNSNVMIFIEGSQSVIGSFDHCSHRRGYPDVHE